MKEKAPGSKKEVVALGFWGAGCVVRTLREGDRSERVLKPGGYVGLGPGAGRASQVCVPERGMVRHFGPIRRSEIGRSQLEWRGLVGKEGGEGGKE